MSALAWQDLDERTKARFVTTGMPDGPIGCNRTQKESNKKELTLKFMAHCFFLGTMFLDTIASIINNLVCKPSF